MALVQCRHCKRAFISAPQDGNYCPPCASRLREVHFLVRGYLRDNAGKVFTVDDISMALNVPGKEIKELIRMGLISF